MKKEEALQIMYKSAILYKNNLENRNILEDIKFSAEITNKLL